MVEIHADKLFQCGRLLFGRERALFNILKEALSIPEPSREVNGLRYMWDKMQSHGTQVMAWLDRCYTFDAGASQPIEQYMIRGNALRSGHCPISLTIQFKQSEA